MYFIVMIATNLFDSYIKFLLFLCIVQGVAQAITTPLTHSDAKPDL